MKIFGKTVYEAWFTKVNPLRKENGDELRRKLTKHQEQALVQNGMVVPSKSGRAKDDDAGLRSIELNLTGGVTVILDSKRNPYRIITDSRDEQIITVPGFKAFVLLDRALSHKRRSAGTRRRYPRKVDQK
ncbi:MAG: hypothetical protein JRN62_03585 [Nitrososphaerota archaeon]|jgi:hypothetical protein|nr:hypothetical protein [Nitrososphaerota archaeon]MDG6948683.1 hypothetical protein [Nitrososphaerota archaeon]